MQLLQLQCDRNILDAFQEILDPERAFLKLEPIAGQQPVEAGDASLVELDAIHRGPGAAAGGGTSTDGGGGRPGDRHVLFFSITPGCSCSGGSIKSNPIKRPESYRIMLNHI